MIGHYDNWVKTSRRLKFASIFSASVAAAVGIAEHFKPDSFENYWFIQFLLTVAHDSAKWVIPFAAGVIILTELYNKIYGPPEIWLLVHHLLDDMHKLIFSPECNLAENRVTLFRVKSFHLTWPWRAWPPLGCWLVPVERSNHLTRKSKASFLVNDDGSADGVAGQAYVQRSCVYVDNLPNISSENADANPSNQYWIQRLFYKKFWPRRYLSAAQLKIVKFYATKSWSKESRVLKHKIAKKNLPRSMCGLPVEVGGKIWGIIVIDSREKNLVGKNEILEFYNRNAGVLSKILEHLK